MITLSKVSKSFGVKTLFENVTATFNPSNRYGLTGPNGAGKTTLFKIMMGKEEATSGSVTLPKRVGILRQDIEHFRRFRVLDVVLMGNPRLWKALEGREELEKVEMTDAIGMRLGEIEGIIAEEDGYSAEANAEILLSGMGIEEEFFQKRMEEIPTDAQFKVLLCQALFGEPQALLLDEPTNHLDLDSIRWLENFLLAYKGTLIVISHDRHFLNTVTTHIADIDYETVIIYPGNYDTMIATKSSVRERAEQETKSKEKKIEQLQTFVARFGAGTRASQVQSRIREISRLQPQELKQSNIQRPYIRLLASTKASGQIAVHAKKLSKGYGESPVLQQFSIEIQRGDKIGVIGANGRGKTTLLKLLAHVLIADAGKVDWGHQAQVSYFPQNHADIIDKSSNQTAFDWLRERRPGIYDQDIRSVLGKMLFGGDDAFKPVSALSGGETARLILAGMMLEEHNILILDEPNNHLDLEAVSALGCGLADYPGTVILASHDRDLIANTATKIISFTDRGPILFNGPLEEYLSRH